MSALMFVSTPRSMETCIGDCRVGKGRWLPMILGKRVEDAPLCGRCRSEWEAQSIAAREPYKASEHALRQAA